MSALPQVTWHHEGRRRIERRINYRVYRGGDSQDWKATKPAWARMEGHWHSRRRIYVAVEAVFELGRLLLLPLAADLPSLE